jgi:hypothetical protein
MDFSRIADAKSIMNKSILELQKHNDQPEYKEVLSQARKIYERLKRVREEDEMVARLRR